MATLDASPGRLDLTFTQGKTWDVTLTVRDSDGGLVDLSGYACTWALRTDYGAATATVSAAAAGTAGATVMGGTAGTIALSVPPSVTAGVAVASYVHEFELTDGSGAKPPFVAGSVQVTAEVVR
jgi:hypothetical protein